MRSPVKIIVAAGSPELVLVLLLIATPRTSLPAGKRSIEGWTKSRYLPDASVWRTPPIRPQGFQFEVQISSLGTSYNPQRVRRSIREHNLGEYESALATAAAAEWGYSFTHLNGQLDGAGRRIQAGYPTPPSTRAECLTVQPRMKAHFRRRKVLMPVLLVA